MSEQLRQNLAELINLPAETEWVEFKHNNSDAEMIGKYLSAISNSAALHRQERGYIVWGVEDGTHRVIGTTFRPRVEKRGNEELENWLLRLLDPDIDFRIHEFEQEGHHMVMFEVPPATHKPVAFERVVYIRVGSYKKKLSEYADKERSLWRILLSTAEPSSALPTPAVTVDASLEFERQIKSVRDFLDSKPLGPPPKQVGEFVLHPSDFKRQWQGIEDLLKVAFSLSGSSGPALTFKSQFIHPLDGSIYYASPQVAWALTLEGLLWLRIPVNDDISRRAVDEGIWPNRPTNFLIYEDTVFAVGHVFALFGKMVTQYSDQLAIWRCSAVDIDGYHLKRSGASTLTGATHAKEFIRPTPSQRNKMAPSEWWDTATMVLKELFDMFAVGEYVRKEQLEAQLRLAGIQSTSE